MPVTGGRCKLQWKPDWAMRWVALGVDYEMAGKDLINSVKLSGEICRALGGMPPEGFNYELFLDEKGQKISKSKGNGLTIDEWLRYASPGKPVAVHVSRAEGGEAALFRRHPAHGRRVPAIPRRLSSGRTRQQLSNPVWHIHSGNPPQGRHAGLVPDAADAGVVVERGERRDVVGLHRPLPAGRDAADASEAQRRWSNTPSIISATSCCRTKKFREPTDGERAALTDLRDALSQLPADASAEDIQNVVYEVGRREPFLDQKKKAKDGKPGVSLDWFNMLYQVLLGQEKGPRFGSFVAVYGLQNTVDMIDGALARSA